MKIRVSKREFCVGRKGYIPSKCLHEFSESQAHLLKLFKEKDGNMKLEFTNSHEQPIKTWILIERKIENIPIGSKSKSPIKSIDDVELEELLTYVVEDSV